MIQLQTKTAIIDGGYITGTYFATRLDTNDGIPHAIHIETSYLQVDLLNKN